MVEVSVQTNLILVLHTRTNVAIVLVHSTRLIIKNLYDRIDDAQIGVF